MADIRRMKNRESAAESRRRKRDHIASLESTAVDLLQRNGVLEDTVAALRRRVEELEKRLARGSDSGSGAHVATRTRDGTRSANGPMELEQTNDNDNQHQHQHHRAAMHSEYATLDYKPLPSCSTNTTTAVSARDNATAPPDCPHLRDSSEGRRPHSGSGDISQQLEALLFLVSMVSMVMTSVSHVQLSQQPNQQHNRSSSGLNTSARLMAPVPRKTTARSPHAIPWKIPWTPYPQAVT